MTDRQTAIQKTTDDINAMKWSDLMNVPLGHLRRSHGIEAMEECLAATTLTQSMKAKLIERQDYVARMGY